MEKFRIFFSELIVYGLFAGIAQVWAQPPNRVLDFGNHPDNTPATTINTMFSHLRTGWQGGGFVIRNGGEEIGVGGEIMGTAPTGASVNTIDVTAAGYGVSSPLFTITFELYFSGGNSGQWYFFAGNGPSFGSNNGFTTADVFSGLQFNFDTGNVINTRYRLGYSWQTLPGNPFSKHRPYCVTIAGNNSQNTVAYGSGQSLLPNTFDLWVNGKLEGDDLGKAFLANDSAINSFRFYAEASIGNSAHIALDNIKWWNACMPPSMAVYSTIPVIPANTYYDISVYKGIARLLDNISVTDRVNMYSGLILLDSYHLNMDTGALFSGVFSDSCFVVCDGTGRINKKTTRAQMLFFPAGSMSPRPEYSPAYLNFTSGVFHNAVVSLNLEGRKFPQNLSINHFTRRFWKLYSSGITAFACTSSCFYKKVPDVAGNQAFIYSGLFDGISWHQGSLADSGLSTLTNTFSSVSNPSVITGTEIWSFPVEFLSFFAARVHDRWLLGWSTANEEDNSGFYVQKSLNGIDWDEIGFVPGAGNSGVIKKYNFEIPAGDLKSAVNNYFRLRQLDYSGKATFSGIVVFRDVKFVEISVYPNPVHKELLIETGPDDDSEIIVDILNHEGGFVKNAGTFRQGKNRVDVAGLSAGIYFLKITEGELFRMLKIIKK